MFSFLLRLTSVRATEVSRRTSWLHTAAAARPYGVLVYAAEETVLVRGRRGREGSVKLCRRSEADADCKNIYSVERERP